MKTTKLFFVFKVVGIVAAAFIVCVTVAVAFGGVPSGAGLPNMLYDVRIEDGRAGLMVSSTEMAIGAQAVSETASTSYGVYGAAKSNFYVGSGDAGDAIGLYGEAESYNGSPSWGGNAIGVKGRAVTYTDGAEAIGVYGEYDNFGTGTPATAYGLKGYVSDSDSGLATGNQFGVYGVYYGASGVGQGYGVYGEISGAEEGGAGVYGKTGSEDYGTYAGYFEGDVGLTGDLSFSLSHATTTGCSVLGSVYFNEHAGELCYCDGDTWRKVSATSTTCD